METEGLPIPCSDLPWIPKASIHGNKQWVHVLETWPEGWDDGMGVGEMMRLMRLSSLKVWSLTTLRVLLCGEELGCMLIIIVLIFLL